MILPDSMVKCPHCSNMTPVMDTFKAFGSKVCGKCYWRITKANTILVPVDGAMPLELLDELTGKEGYNPNAKDRTWYFR